MGSSILLSLLCRIVLFSPLALIMSSHIKLVSGDAFCSGFTSGSNCVARASFLASSANNRYPLLIGSEVLGFMELGQIDNSGFFTSTYLTQYFPLVDSIAYFNVAWNAMLDEDVSIRLGLIKGNTTVRTPQPVVYGSVGRFPEYRVAIANVEAGNLVSLSWMQTSCNLSNCLCITTPNETGYDICGTNCITAYNTTASGCNSGVNVYLLWTGTDYNGNALTSVNRNPYNLQHVFA